jgi:hypothetical protein
MRAQLGEKPFGRIVYNHAHIVAPFHVQGGKSSRGFLYVIEIIFPGVRLPDAISFLTDRGFRIAKRLRVLGQQLRQRQCAFMGLL